MRRCWSIFMLMMILLNSCSVSKNYKADKKYPVEELQQDFTLLRNILETKHPSLYWYTPKDTMDRFFDVGYKSITDSMTELQFGWKVIAPLTSKIRCGHTSFGMSKAWNKFMRNRRIPSLPLYMRVWKDTMVVTANLNRKDSVLRPGTLITSTNNVRNREMIKTMFGYMVEDGNADNVNYLRLSSNFPYYHRNVFGLFGRYTVQYLDNKGIERKTILPMFATPDSTNKKTKSVVVKQKKIPKEKQLESMRSLKYDSTGTLATLKITTFSKGHLKTFFRQAFRKLEKKPVVNLVVDIRGNGGGEITNSVMLTRFLRNTKFKVCDTAFATAKSLAPYTRYVRWGILNNIGLLFLTKKHADGEYHFGYWERHEFKPKRNNHYNGNVYVLTNGLTFSASSLFAHAVKRQDNIKLIGEETGGGWYGNSGLAIPDIILPNTRLRVRLPLFRLVQYQHPPVKGTGVMPDIFVTPTVKDTRSGEDMKMKKVREMIGQKSLSH